MKVMFVAGGTGGHFYPGLAIAKEFQSDGHSVKFIVRKGDYVLTLLEREKIPFSTISAAGFRRSLHWSNLMAPFKLFLGFFESFFILWKWKPRLVVVLGGYLSVPPAIGAKLLGIPLLLHEQNVTPGLANRFLAFIASRVAVSFSESVPMFGRKAELTGNPLRSEFRVLPGRGEALQRFQLDPNRLTVLVFGGSLGARKINQMVLEALEQLKPLADKLQLLHFSGPKEEEAVEFAYKMLPFKNFVAGYCHDMASAYSAADFVICRSGASTVTELIAAKKPALLIPYPFATDDHQTKNARVISDAKAGLLFEEKKLTVDSMKFILDDIVRNPAKIQAWKSGFGQININPLAAASKIKAMGKDLAGV